MPNLTDGQTGYDPTVPEVEGAILAAAICPEMALGEMPAIHLIEEAFREAAGKGLGL
jgi:hypothetical protein